MKKAALSFKEEAQFFQGRGTNKKLLSLHQCLCFYGEMPTYLASYDQCNL